MTVKELKAILDTCQDDMEIILQKDAEGNGYSPLDCWDDDCVYVEENKWDGSVYNIHWSAEDACVDEDQWKSILKLPKVLVLIPTN